MASFRGETVGNRIVRPAILGVLLLWCGGRSLLFGQGAPPNLQVPGQRKSGARRNDRAITVKYTHMIAF